jgi:hypothetical protein
MFILREMKVSLCQIPRQKQPELAEPAAVEHFKKYTALLVFRRLEKTKIEEAVSGMDTTSPG